MTAPTETITRPTPRDLEYFILLSRQKMAMEIVTQILKAPPSGKVDVDRRVQDIALDLRSALLPELR